MVIEHAYAELGLAPGASEAQVKAAWRRLVAQWHPDRNAAPGALARMQRINTAYETIRLGPDDAAAPAQAPDPAAAVRPLRRRVRLSLEEAATGCVKPVRGQRSEVCTSCDGAGELRRPGWYGWMASTAPCSACAGRGRLARGYRHTVRIPPGARAGDRLQAHTAGATLELQIEIAPHPLFTLDADGTLRCEMPVDGFAWMAERWVEVPTLAGLQHMRLRRAHRSYRLRGQGFPDRGGARGDCVVTIEPRFPDSLSAEQEALLERLSAAGTAPLADWQRRLRAWERRRA